MGVEEDEGVVADPALVAAGIFKFRGQVQGLADGGDAVVDLHVFGGAEVVDLGVVLGVAGGVAARGVEEGLDAVLHVEVALALLAVAEDAEAVGVFDELFVEVEDVAVGVAFAEDGDEAEDVGFVDLAALGVGGEEAFAGGLGGAVEGGLDGEGVGLGGGALGGDVPILGAAIL